MSRNACAARGDAFDDIVDLFEQVRALTAFNSIGKDNVAIFAVAFPLRLCQDPTR